MPRSTYVYLVRSGDLLVNATPVAAFTVKHELRSWLHQRSPEIRAEFHVYRMPDGGGGAVTDMSISEILEGNR